MQAPGAAFSYRQTGCCGFPVTSRGTFAVQGGQVSFSMSLAGSGSARKALPAVLVQDRLYVRVGKKWKSSALGGRGYPAAADQVRQGSSVTNLTTLLRSATKLTLAKGIYEGEAPAATLAQAPELGPMYGRMAQATGAQQIAFAIKLDAGHRPVAFWVRAGPEKGRNQMQRGTYQVGRQARHQGAALGGVGVPAQASSQASARTSRSRSGSGSASRPGGRSQATSRPYGRTDGGATT